MKIKRNYKTYTVIGVVLGILLGTFMGVMARADSFGSAKNIKTNDFYKDFKNHVFWTLSYKRYNYSEWSDGSDYLTIEKTFIEEEQYFKFNLILDVPVDIYEAKFGFAVDKIVKNYADRIDRNRYYINYSNFSVYFDWSDLLSIPNLEYEHGVIGGYFYFGFGRKNIPMGYYEFDPYFGNIEGISQYLIEDKIIGRPSLFISECEHGCNANITNISVYLQNDGNMSYIAGLYFNSTKILIAETECIDIDLDGSWTWVTLDFQTNYTLVNNTVYELCIWSNASAEQYSRLKINNSGGWLDSQGQTFACEMVNPYNPSSNQSYDSCIICNYECICEEGEEEQNYTLDDEGCYCFSLAPSLIGFILIIFFFIYADKRGDPLLSILCGIISFVMGIYYLVLLDGVAYTSWIGIVLILFSIYTTYLSIVFYKFRRINK